MAEEDEGVGEAPVKKGKGKLFMLIGIALVVLGGGGFAAKTFLLSEPEEPEDAEMADAAAEAALNQSARYYPILPPLTTNFSDDQGRRRFMQVSLEVRTQEQSVVDAVKDHNAVIRNALLMAYSDIDYDSVTTREGKEALRELSLTEVQRVLEEQTGSPGIDDIFFTAFVLQ